MGLFDLARSCKGAKKHTFQRVRVCDRSFSFGAVEFAELGLEVWSVGVCALEFELKALSFGLEGPRGWRLGV